MIADQGARHLFHRQRLQRGSPPFCGGGGCSSLNCTFPEGRLPATASAWCAPRSACNRVLTLQLRSLRDAGEDEPWEAARDDLALCPFRKQAPSMMRGEERGLGQQPRGRRCCCTGRRREVVARPVAIVPMGAEDARHLPQNQAPAAALAPTAGEPGRAAELPRAGVSKFLAKVVNA